MSSFFTSAQIVLLGKNFDTHSTLASSGIT
uniref:Uncharacterized protein n=1 Tax=Podoviridae sp. ctsNK10 TaxID=2826582 RepID=A0A8S5NM23_9CAUD|nr:MAG TPA: hypothetical protein [Podoviridae sp. ctsNK10]